ncbi:putative FBD-associated F-box protein At1g61330 [Cannabis sativa]|uniref:putative FBD-associated F-box protein At1g61330 n=1 Tax=Cannabis sativa TaxID=3483 RepID=UPI0011DF06FB|nr:putative FBD-associated F-box protein At1g61330 [Cannabis sativa]
MAPITRSRARKSLTQASLLVQKPNNKENHNKIITGKRAVGVGVPHVENNRRIIRKSSSLIPSYGGNVGDDVLAHIFTYLPTRILVQLSVMSKRFKNTWRYCRNLLFGNEFYRKLHNRTEFIDVVTRIMDNHIGENIDTLQILMDPTDKEHRLTHWIKIALNKGVKVLDLDCDLSLNIFKFHHSLLDSETLRVLKLKYCKFSLPSRLRLRSAAGLGFITTLVLRKVVFCEFTVYRIMKHCVNLESLDMTDCSGPSVIRIMTHDDNFKFKSLKVGNSMDMFYIDVNCPNLESLHYSGSVLQGIRILMNNDPPTSKLKDVMLNFSTPRTGITPYYYVEKILHLNLYNVSTLTITSTVMEGACAKMRNGSFGSLDFCLWHLKELQVFMDYTTFCNAVDIADFVGKCPSLQKLFLDVNNFNLIPDLYYELHQKPFIESFSTIFENLKVMKLKGFKFLNQEIDLVRMFLKRSPEMEEMILVYPKNKDHMNMYIDPGNEVIFNRLFQDWKCSPKIQIIAQENAKDKTISPTHVRKWY